MKKPIVNINSIDRIRLQNAEKRNALKEKYKKFTANVIARYPRIISALASD